MIKRVLSILFIMLSISEAESQGLFESSLSEASEKQDQNVLTIGGFIRSAAYLGQTAGNEDLYFQSAFGQAGLQLKVKTGTNVSGFADIRFRFGTEWQEPVSEFDLREAYVDLQTGPAGFRFGKLIAPWGKGSMFNPVNKITPMDPTRRSPDSDDMNLGIWALQGDLNLGSYLKLSAIWNPVYQPGTLLIEPIPMPGYVNFLEPAYPDVTLDEGNYGFRVDLRAPALDAAVYWFDGYHSWPGIAFDSFILDTLSMEPVALNLYEKAYRIRMAGLDFSIPVGSWILRAEGAWTRTTESHQGKEYLPFPELSYTAEIEKSFNSLTAIAGYYGKFILDYIPAQAPADLSAEQEQLLPLVEGGTDLNPVLLNSMVGEQIAAFNRLYNYQLEEYYHSAFLVLKGDFFHNALEISLPLVYNITTEEWIAQPYLAWKPADGLRVQAGFTGLWGPPNSLYDLAGPILNAGYIAMTIKF